MTRAGAVFSDLTKIEIVWKHSSKPSVAINLTACVPSCVSAGVHVKVPFSNTAPCGKLSVDKLTASPSGSLPETANVKVFDTVIVWLAMAPITGARVCGIDSDQKGFAVEECSI